MEVVFFDHVDSPKPARIIELDPQTDRTSNYWHIFVPGIGVGQLYGYRANGPSDPLHSERFECSKVLLDPYGKSVAVGGRYCRDSISRAGDDAAIAMKSVVTDLSTFN